MKSPFAFIPSLTRRLNTLFQTARAATIIIAIASASQIIAPAAVGQTILVVDDGSTAPNPNGESWETAFPYLQDAITQALIEDPPVQIWVAAGTYYPDDGDGITPNARANTFAMHNNVKMYGGFVGNEPLTTPGFQSRNPATNITILSGEIQQDNDIDSRRP